MSYFSLFKTQCFPFDSFIRYLFALLGCFEWEGNQHVWLQVGVLPTFVVTVPCRSQGPLGTRTPHCLPRHVFPRLCILTCAYPSEQSWLRSASITHCFVNTRREAAAGVKRNPWSRFPKEGGESIPLKWLPAEEFPEEGWGQPLRQLLRHCLHQQHSQLCRWGKFAEAALWLNLVWAPVLCWVYLNHPLCLLCSALSVNHLWKIFRKLTLWAGRFYNW